MTKRNPYLRNRGVHLLEVIVASSLFFMVSLFLLTLLPSAQWASRKAEDRVLAEGLVHSEIERLRGEPFSNLVAGASPTQTLQFNNTSFELQSEVSLVAAANPQLLKNVNVSVSWLDNEQRLTVRGSSYINKVRQ